MGAKRERFSRLESEVDVLCERWERSGRGFSRFQNEVGCFERWERSGFWRLQSEVYVLVKDGSEASSQDFRAKLTCSWKMGAKWGTLRTSERSQRACERWERSEFSRLQSEADVLAKDGSEAGKFPRLQSEADMMWRIGAKRVRFWRLQSEADVLVKDGSEAGTVLKTSERSWHDCERWERSGRGFSGLQREINEPLVINLPLSDTLLSLPSLEQLW